MKKLISAFIVLVAMFAASSNVNAQGVSINSVSLDSWDTIKFSYSPTTISILGEDIVFNGFSFEYMQGQNIVDNKPVFLEWGIGAEILNYTDEYSDYYDGYRVYSEDKITIADMYIPVNIGYKLALNNNTIIMPYVGIKAQYNLSGKETVDVSVEGYSASEEYDLFSTSDMEGSTWKRAWISWHIGATIEMNTWSIGIRYGKCFSDEIEKHHDSELTSATISIGYFF